MAVKVEDCERCMRVLREYRERPGKVMQLTPQQEWELLREWHAQDHPDMNARGTL